MATAILRRSPGPRPLRRGGRLTARRRRRSRVAAATLLGVLVVAGAVGAVAAWRAGAVEIRHVTVRGADRSGTAAVLAAVGPVTGTPLPLLDTTAAAGRVAELPLVEAVTVSRRWPDAVSVTVSERVPVAAVPVAAGVALVDDTGVTVEVLPPGSPAPEGLPSLQVDPTAGAGPLTAARQVALALPTDLRARTTSIGAVSAADVRLVVDGREVRWGTADDVDRKAAVLRALLEVPAGSYDVSAPDAPATRP